MTLTPRRRDLVDAAALGALTLLDPHRLSGRALTAYRTAVAGYTAITLERSLREDPEQTVGEALRTPLALATAAVTYATMNRWEKWDDRTQRWLQRHGVRRPRLVLAGVSVASVLVSAVADRRVQERAIRGDQEEFQPRLEPLDSRLREVLRAILGSREDYGAAALRRQLADAMVEEWGDPEATGASLPEFVELSLRQDDHERIVPSGFTFPVRARTRGGHEIRLVVADGLLSHVLLDWAPGHPIGDEDWPTEWPSFDEVTLVADGDAQG